MNKQLRWTSKTFSPCTCELVKCCHPCYYFMTEGYETCFLSFFLFIMCISDAGWPAHGCHSGWIFCEVSMFWRMQIIQINIFYPSDPDCSKNIFSLVCSKSTVTNTDAVQQYQRNINAQTWTSIKSKSHREWRRRKKKTQLTKRLILASFSNTHWLPSHASSLLPSVALPSSRRPPLPCRQSNIRAGRQRAPRREPSTPSAREGPW